MFGFFLKKSFCDFWDNLLYCFFCNTILLVGIAAVLMGMASLANAPALPPSLQMITSLGLAAIGAFVVLLFYASLNRHAKEIAFYKAPSLKETFQGIGKSWKEALVLLAMILIMALLCLVGIPFYLQMGSLFGLFLASMLFWAVFITVMAMQWFLPLRAQLDDPIMKSVRKCYLLFFDNPGFTFAMFLYSLVLTALSVFLVGLLPSFMGLLVEWNVALKLRMYKYDWIEQHPEVPVKEVKHQINWYDLLEYDRDTIGPRTLKNIFFPWK